MKKNLKYEELESFTYINPQGLVTHIDKKVLFSMMKVHIKSV